MDDNKKEIEFSDAVKEALDGLERIEFDVTVKLAKGFSCKGTIFVKRNPIDGEG